MRLFKILFKDIGIQKILKKTSIHIIRNSRFRGKRIGLSGSRRVKRTISQKGLSSFSIRLKYIQYTKYERRFTNPPIASAVAESQILETPIPLTNLQKSSPTITTAWKPKDSKTSLGCQMRKQRLLAAVYRPKGKNRVQKTTPNKVTYYRLKYLPENTRSTPWPVRRWSDLRISLQQGAHRYRTLRYLLRNGKRIRFDHDRTITWIILHSPNLFLPPSHVSSRTNE